MFLFQGYERDKALQFTLIGVFVANAYLGFLNIRFLQRLGRTSMFRTQLTRQFTNAPASDEQSTAQNRWSPSGRYRRKEHLKSRQTIDVVDAWENGFVWWEQIMFSPESWPVYRATVKETTNGPGRQ
jgi:hypothetical protein